MSRTVKCALVSTTVNKIPLTATGCDKDHFKIDDCAFSRLWQNALLVGESGDEGANSLPSDIAKKIY